MAVPVAMLISSTQNLFYGQQESKMPCIIMGHTVQVKLRCCSMHTSETQCLACHMRQDVHLGTGISAPALYAGTSPLVLL